MSNIRKGRLNCKAPSLLSSGVAVLFAAASCAPSQTPEIDSFSRAVAAQEKEEALLFVDQHRSSPLVGDLIELLRPEVALDVCSDMPSGVSREGRRACEQLQATAATDPVLGPSKPLPTDAGPPLPKQEVGLSSRDQEVVSASRSRMLHRPAAKPAPKSELANSKAPEPPKKAAPETPATELELADSKAPEPPKKAAPETSAPEPELANSKAPEPPRKAAPETSAHAPQKPIPTVRYVIQLASSSSADKAATTWQRLQKAHPVLLAKRSLAIQQAEVVGHGTVFRVQTGGFESLARARAFCTAFRAQDQECLVVKLKGIERHRTNITRKQR